MRHGVVADVEGGGNVGAHRLALPVRERALVAAAAAVAGHAEVGAEIRRELRRRSGTNTHRSACSPGPARPRGRAALAGQADQRFAAHSDRHASRSEVCAGKLTSTRPRRTPLRRAPRSAAARASAR